MVNTSASRAAPDVLDENVLFRLPLATDTNTHFYFDRDPTSAAHAWDGSTRSYNGHTGSDFSGGPRGTPIYAAADGILVYKEDGWGDQGGTANGNYVKINHGNDRNGIPIYTYYLHMNAGSVTSKPLGSLITAGEQIGGVGTSGNSTGLHLHFHLSYSGVATDPFAATGETSWWNNQNNGRPTTATPAKKFNVGDWVQVFALNGGTLTVRSPDPTSSSIGSQVDGAIGQVTGGATLSYLNNDYTNNVYTRYKVRFTNGLEGWVAQNWIKTAALPEIGVQQGATSITDGQAGAVNFGNVQQGMTGPSLAFTVTNSGSQPLTLGVPSLPAGYTLVEGLTSPLNPGASDTFTVRLDSATMGTKSGSITFSTNDPDENPFNFPITGAVTGDIFGPTVDVVDITPDPFTGPLSSATIIFNEPVIGFGISDLTLTRGGGNVPLTAAQTLTTSDNITFTLSGLSAVTQFSGTYVLTVTGGVTDTSGNALQAAASDTFKIMTPQFRGDATAAVTDNYYVRRSADGTKLEVSESTFAFFTPTYSLPLAGVSGVTFDCLGGDNLITLDYLRGDPLAGLTYSFLGAGGNNTLKLVNTGTLTLPADLSAGLSNLSLLVGSSTVVFNASQRLAALTIDTGKIDLRDKSLILDYSSTSPIGTWNGSKYTGMQGWAASGNIFSSTAGSGYGVAIAEASDALALGSTQTAMWNTRTVDDTTVLIRYTLGGDANVDGQLNGDDYFRIDSGLGTPGAGYARGDFDLNGKVDADDYFLIDSNYNKPAVPLGAAMAVQPQTVFAIAAPNSAFRRLQDDPAGELPPLV